MASKNGSKLVLAETFTANINIDKNDLLAVAVSKAEGHMQTRLAAATKEIRRLEKEIKTNDASLKTRVDAQATKLAKPTVTALEKAKEVSGSKMSTEVNWTMAAGKRTYTVNVMLKAGDHYGGRVTFAELTGNFDNDSTSLADQVDADTVSLAQARETAVEWRKKLAQIPTLERQYRARIAESALSKTEQGQALLDALGGEFEQDVLALPNL